MGLPLFLLGRVLKLTEKVGFSSKRTKNQLLKQTLAWARSDENRFFPWHIPQFWQRLVRQGRISAILGAGVGVLSWSGTAIAAETVILKYREAELAVPMTELEAFADSGTMSADLQTFFQAIPVDAALDAERVRQFLTAGSLINFASIEAGRSFVGEFPLLQLDKVMGPFLRQENLQPLSQAIATASEDHDPVTVLHILAAYPDPTIYFDLASYEGVLSDTTIFVERIMPILQIIEQLLPELVCDCEASSDSPTILPSQIESTPEGLPEAEPVDAAMANPDCLDTSLLNWAIAPSTSSPDLKSLTPDHLPTISTANPLRSALPLEIALANSDSRGGAQELVFTLGPLSPSFAIADLETLASTGEVPQSLRFYLSLADVDPEVLRSILNREVEVNGRSLDRLLNSLLGEYALYQLGQVMHTPSRQANIQALRSALVMSTLDDNQMTLLEVLQNYPTPQIYVDGLNLLRIASATREIIVQRGRPLEDSLLKVQAAIASNYCDCDTLPETPETLP
jgi:hypothetical protein